MESTQIQVQNNQNMMINQIAMNLFNFDQNGSISLDQFRQFLQQNDIILQESQIQLILNKTDQKHQGFINFYEFISLLEKVLQNYNFTEEEELIESFKFFDRKGKGRITFKELKIGMQKMGEELSDEELYKMIEIADEDEDGCLNFQEFSKMMLTL